MRTLLFGIVLIIVLGVGSLVYRNAVEHPLKPIACPLDAKVCPDGTSVGRTGLSCTFPACPPPNVSLDTVGVAYAVPSGFASASLPDEASVADYAATDASSTEASAEIVVRDYPIEASSTALATIQATAIGGASGAPVPETSFTSAMIGSHRFTVVSIERFEGVVDTAYYLARGSDVLRFDAIDRGVAGWTDPSLDVSSLKSQSSLRTMLTTLQGG